MPENKQTKQQNVSADWLIQGVLTKIGDIFDRFTGRNWKPSSSLATSELTERLKKLLDSEVRDVNGKAEFVPHNIKLKMQWDKFSTDQEEAIEKLENELLIAAVDHINDKRYHTYAPIKIEIKPDYFTEGVKLQAGFEKFVDEKARATQIKIDLPELSAENIISQKEKKSTIDVDKKVFIAEFDEKGILKQKNLIFAPKERLSVGRTPENDLIINDASISKIHAALVLNSEDQILVADTGSTNGTYIGGERIAYGKATPINEGDKLKFGTVEVKLKYVSQENEQQVKADEGIADKTKVLPTESNLDKTQQIVVLSPINDSSD